MEISTTQKETRTGVSTNVKPSNVKPGLSPEFAGVIRETLLYWASRELETTKKVLSAIPDAKSNYRPDPNARTAWELAWHLASMDIHFLDGIADFQLNLDVPYGESNPTTVESNPTTVAELVD